ncbi:hypothetical protein SAMN04488128_1011192 [Chitinophaga eiseniae]|uniref:Helix-turn-helix domain-containing protein n=1 Tax=Chitinophaga eiseniae TaxID=634771 RepID=A0A1T4MNM7_9BACT|nr:hypothetical protein [Chitinophaga eiseniae]SJZ68481.1 hypothetical protein SAMN04488128_1011192 [Chitinophaga eiseniae]
MDSVKNDGRVGATHLSLYLALFQVWNQTDFEEPISINRPEVLEMAKISRSTYHRCMNDLNELGYVKYIPSYHPILGSIVYMADFQDSSGRPQNKID